MISVDSNADKVSGGFEKLSGILLKSIVEIGIYIPMATMKRDAINIHRYKRKTGKLGRSVKLVKRSDGGMLYADDTYCAYAKYVHLGQRSWKPDEFLFEALNRNDRYFDKQLETAVDVALKKAGI